MKWIPEKLDYISIALAIASLVAVKVLYPDVFRGSRFWVLSGYLAAILGILAVGLILYSQLKANQIGFLTLISATIVLYGLWLVQDAANPETRFRVLKEAYIRQAQSGNVHESSGYVSWDMKLDFFECPVADRLRADKALIDSLAKGLALTKKWKDLGRGLYYDDYADQSLICYASLIEQGYSEAQIMEMPYGKNIMAGILFYELHRDAYYGTVPRKMQTLLASLPQNPKAVFQKLSIGQIGQVNEMTIYELEMFLYFLTQYPVQIGEDKLQQLFAVWKAQKPTYAKDIEQLLTARDELKKWIHLNGNERQEILGVNFGKAIPLENQQPYLEKIKPFLHLLGHEFTIGEDIPLMLNQESALLVERSQSIYENVEKTRQVTDRYKVGNHYTSKVRTERYTESVYAGSKKTNVYQRQLTLSLAEGDEPKKLLFSLSEFLPHQFFNQEKRDYEIPYQQMNRRECWVLALPQSWYCPGCEDY